MAPISQNIKGRPMGFENVYFKDAIKNAKSRTHSPEISKLLPDEIVDSDFDFEQFSKGNK